MISPFALSRSERNGGGSTVFVLPIATTAFAVIIANQSQHMHAMGTMQERQGC